MKIAVITSDARYEIQSAALRGIIDEAQKENTSVFIFTCSSPLGFLPTDDDPSASDFRLFNCEDYDGIILYGDTIPDRGLVKELADSIVASGKPALSVKDPIDGMLYAGFDNKSGIRDIVRFLVEKQHKKRIYFISGPDYNDDSNERLAVYKETLAEYGIYPEDSWIYQGTFHPHSGRDAFNKWYKERKENPMPEAIVCANDEMATGVIRAANLHGLSIPDDLLVSGFDNRLISEISKPAITTVPIFGYDLGCLCARKLLDRILGRPDNAPDNIYPKAIFRESTDPECNDNAFEHAMSEMQDYYMNGRAEISNLLEGLRDMESGFADALTWEDLYEKLGEHMAIFEAEAFYLFAPSRELNPDATYVMSLLRGKDADTLTGDSEMMVPIAWESGEMKEYPPFPARKFIPDEIINNTSNGYYVVSPLLHHDRIFGYCVTANSAYAYESEWFSLFIQIMRSAMENLRRKAQLSQLVDTLNHLWIYDKLTGVLNRAGFAEKNDEVLHEARKYSDGNVFVLFADLDRLKYVNDTYGHDAGDSFISESADILKRVFSHGELIMRYGGDEFVVLSGKTTEKKAASYTAAIEMAMGKLNKSKKYDFPVSMSVGYIIGKAENDTELESLIEEADRLMYEVKVRKKTLRED